MKSVIFGGIGTIANTSFLQRRAFNDAFKQLSIDWHWNEDEYRRLLVNTGGESRIAQYHDTHGGLPSGVTPGDVHQLKTRLFHELMASTTLPLRPGVAWVIEQAKLRDIKIMFATTTSAKNVEGLLSSAGLAHSTFTVIGNVSKVDAVKPKPDIYAYCLSNAGLSAGHSIAIEDANTGVDAAVAAGIKCIAFPNEFTHSHDFTKAVENVDDLEQSAQLQSFLNNIG